MIMQIDRLFVKPAERSFMYSLRINHRNILNDVLSISSFFYQQTLTDMKKVKYACNGYFKHKHWFKFTANLCGVIQSYLPINKIYFFWLWMFDHTKLQKILMASQGGNKRAMLRRIKKGVSPI